VFSGVAPNLLESGAWYVRDCPLFWFLGIYQRILEGPSALPIYAQLAHTACTATLLAVAIVIVTYPLAYLRRTHQLVEGAAAHSHRGWSAKAVSRVLHALLVRSPERRAIFHFVTQTLLRVPRYRIYLVLYGGVGLSALLAAVLRFSVIHNQVRMAISEGGLRASAGIAAFWVIAGLRIAFLSPGNQQGSWVFHFIHGRPAEMGTALKQLSAVKTWALLFVAVVAGSVFLLGCAIAPPDFLAWRAVTAQFLVAAVLCLLLTDFFFLHVTTVAFTAETVGEPPNLAMAVAKYFTFFPIVVWLSLVAGPWIEDRGWRYVAIPAGVVAVHWLIELRHRDVVRQHCLLFDPDNRENLFLLRLGLRKYSVGPSGMEIPATEEDAGVGRPYEPVYLNPHRDE
jgi:hypothetical protein